MDEIMTNEEERAAARRRQARQERGQVAAKGPARPVPFPEVPDSGEEVQILSTLGIFPTWIQYRGYRQREFLKGLGMSHGWTHDGKVEVLREQIARRKPSVVLNEAWRLPPRNVSLLARAFPKVKFVSLTHATPVWIATDRTLNHYEFLRLARELPNCYYGTVMDESRVIRPPGTKVVSIPNFLTIPTTFSPDHGYRGEGPPCISLMGRDNQPTKLWGSSISIVEEVAKKVKDLHVLIAAPKLSHGVDAYVDHLRDVGVPVVRHGWGPWEDYIHRIATQVDMNLTTSVQESFCLVPLEHCAMGRPAVGTFAVEWLPEDWKVNPQNPAEAAETVVHILSRMARKKGRKGLGNVARRYAHHVSQHNHKMIQKTLTYLIFS